MENNFAPVMESPEKEGSVVRGIIGAILGALLGAVIWCVVAVATEKIFSLIGLAIGFIVGYGYDLLKGRKGTVRMVTVLVCVILSVVVGMIGAYAWWIHESYVEETEFIATATKEELAEAYLTPDELAELNTYPAPLKTYALESLEITMPAETEYFQLFLTDESFLSEVGGECVSSIFFALLGSFALILSNGKKEKAASSNVEAAAVNFDEAAVNLEPAADEETNKNIQA